MQGCRARLPSRLPGKAAGQGCRARLPSRLLGRLPDKELPGKAAGRARGQGLLPSLSGKDACNVVKCQKSIIALARDQ
jgi:hypothetical protein